MKWKVQHEYTIGHKTYNQKPEQIELTKYYSMNVLAIEYSNISISVRISLLITNQKGYTTFGLNIFYEFYKSNTDNLIFD